MDLWLGDRLSKIWYGDSLYSLFTFQLRENERAFLHTWAGCRQAAWRLTSRPTEQEQVLHADDAVYVQADWTTSSQFVVLMTIDSSRRHRARCHMSRPNHPRLVACCLINETTWKDDRRFPPPGRRGDRRVMYAGPAEDHAYESLGGGWGLATCRQLEWWRPPLATEQN